MLKVDAARRRCMNSRSHPTSLLLLAVALTITASPALGQQRDSLQALKRLTLDQLMNVEVTSVSRRAERLAQTASAIQVITQEDIRQSGATSLPEALRLAANLQVAQINSREWAISARGFNSPRANYRIYGKGFARDRTLLPNGQAAADDWRMGQGGFRIDWDASTSNRLTLQGDLYDGRSNQLSPGDIAITGKNLIAKWGHTVSAHSD